MSFPNRGEGPPLGKNSHIFPFFSGNVPELKLLFHHNDHLRPTTGKFLKLEKEEVREREMRRKAMAA